MAVPVEMLDLNAPSEDFAGDLVSNPIPADVFNGSAHARDLAKLFLAGVPWYEWDLYSMGAVRMLRRYTQYLVQLPEFQLT